MPLASTELELTRDQIQTVSSHGLVSKADLTWILQSADSRLTTLECDRLITLSNAEADGNVHVDDFLNWLGLGDAAASVLQSDRFKDEAVSQLAIPFITRVNTDQPMAGAHKAVQVSAMSGNDVRPIEEFTWRRLHDAHLTMILLVPDLSSDDLAQMRKLAGNAPTSKRMSGATLIDVPEGNMKSPLHRFKWYKLLFEGNGIFIPKLTVMEEVHISKACRAARDREGVLGMGDTLGDMVLNLDRVKQLAARDQTFNPDKLIQHVVMIVVVEAEIKRIVEELGFSVDEEATKSLLNLATVRSGQYGSYKLSVLKVADSEEFNRHYSGYTQAGAIAAMASKVLQPDLIISFGTAGGMPDKVPLAGVVLAHGCLFLSRLRSSSLNALEWGIFGGSTAACLRMTKELGIISGPVASQIGYGVSDLELSIIRQTGIVCLDMEAAPIAQILAQTKVNMIALKVISNGVYPGNPHRMETEYVENREEVSRKATEILRKVLSFIDGKTIEDL